MKKQILILLSLFGLATMAFAQNYVPVAPGEGTLAAAIAAAADGDVLQLIPDALYTESVASSFGVITNKNIAIVVDGDGSVKAMVQILTPVGESVTRFFLVGDGASLTLRGLELDGASNGIASASYVLRCYMGEAPAPANIKTLRIENCVIKNLKSNVIDAGDTNMAGYVVVDSTMIDDCVMHNTATSVYYKYAGANYISVTNSTFYNITSYGMRIAGAGYSLLPDNTPEVIVDHTTWYNVGLADGREIILAEKGIPGYFLKPWTVSNSIFVKQTLKSKTVVNIKETLNDNMAKVSSICMWDVGKRSWLSHTVVDTITMNPQFADTLAGDFTLPPGSILLTYGTDKKPIGDPRWAGNASAVAQGNEGTPIGFSLQQNFPNPFNPVTTVSFELKKAGQTTLVIYDAKGREVAALIDGARSAGLHRVDFDASNLASGVYLYRLTFSGQSVSKKMMIIK